MRIIAATHRDLAARSVRAHFAKTFSTDSTFFRSKSRPFANVARTSRLLVNYFVFGPVPKMRKEDKPSPSEGWRL